MTPTHPALSSSPAGGTPTPTRPLYRARGATAASSLLSALLAAVAAADQLGARRLISHANEVYASHADEPAPSLMYGLVYAVAAVGLVGWLLAHRAARARHPWWGLAAVSVMILKTVGFSLVLLLVTEYGERVFPPFWGLLAGSPALTGVVALGLLLLRQRSEVA